MVTLAGAEARARMRSTLWIAASAVVCLAAYCRITTGPDHFDQLPIHRAAWEALHITNYQYDYLLTGFFINYAGKPIRIVVRDGAVQSAVFIANGELAPGPTSNWPTIDQLFVRAAQASAAGTLIGIRYDSRYDFPTQIDISGPPDASGSLFATNLEPAAIHSSRQLSRRTSREGRLGGNRR